jgi:hypothetical protein
VNPGVARAQPAEPGSGGSQAESPGGIFCTGDGADGRRIQAIYARPESRPDRYSAFLASIRQWAAGVDSVFDQSAAQTGGSRHLRFVHDGSCTLTVDNVVLSASGADSMYATMDELDAKGYDRSDRKYLVWMDATVYCGIATLSEDDSPGQRNSSELGPDYARVDAGCWGLQPSVEAHEVMHMLGAVQDSAPHSSGAGHCVDEYDRMCYEDGTLPLVYLCPTNSLELLFDCNHDDYFNTNPAPGSYLATHWNAAASSFLVPGLAPAQGAYTAVDPARILDTRTGEGGRLGRVLGGETIDLQVTNSGGVPATGVSAAVLNVTVTETTANSWLTVYPAGVPRPLASNLNFTPGQTVPNLVLARVGDGGRVRIYLDGGAAQVIADVAGWISDTASGAAGRYVALEPARVLDTRFGTGGVATPIGPGAALDVQVAGRAGVPGAGASAVVLNATVVGPSRPGYLTLYPAGGAVPLASNLNFAPGQTVANRVVVKLGTAGKVSVFNSLGSTDVVLDVAGWFTDSTAADAATGLSSALTPARVLDTRTGVGGIWQRVGGGVTDVQIAGRGGVPGSGASAAILNVTVTGPVPGGYMTIFPSGSNVPLASDLNFAAGQTVPNLVVAKLGSNGKIGLFLDTGSTDVVIDVVGWISQEQG